MERYAASEIVIDGSVYRNYVVEVSDGRLSAMYKLDAELPNTKWYRRIEFEHGLLVRLIDL